MPRIKNRATGTSGWLLRKKGKAWGCLSIVFFRKIAIEDLAILQTGDLAAILRYRRIFSPHCIDDIRLVVKMASASSDSQLASLPKNQCLFLVFL
jgi:hypothetical protein